MAFTSPKMGLRIWDQLSDPYDHNQLADNLSKLDFHDHTPGRGVQIPTEGLADGAITASKLATNVFGPGSVPTNSLADAALLGLTDGTVVRRGKCIIAGAETRVGTITAYDLMPTPDRVPGLVLPTDGLICVGYQATWSQTVQGGARAALFLGANQVRVASSVGSAAFLESGFGGTANVDAPFAISATGIITQDATTTNTDVATGQALGAVGNISTANIIYGGTLAMFAAAGTYDVSVRFKASAGNVTVKNRRLWAWTIGF